MYQPWSTGRHLLQKFTVSGINYSLVFQAQKDDAPQGVLWWDWVCTGTWSSNPPQIVIDMENAALTGTDMGKTPEQYVSERVIIMNKYLSDYFQGVVPVQYYERVEEIIQNLYVDMSSGVPTIKMGGGREWGADSAKNKWMAQKTKYQGNFGGGQFGTWAAANGWDVNALNAEYNALP
jgi:hypothetical protein